jgi:hypothetical protein
MAVEVDPEETAVEAVPVAPAERVVLDGHPTRDFSMPTSCDDITNCGAVRPPRLRDRRGLRTANPWVGRVAQLLGYDRLLTELRRAELLTIVNTGHPLDGREVYLTAARSTRSMSSTGVRCSNRPRTR